MPLEKQWYKKVYTLNRQRKTSASGVPASHAGSLGFESLILHQNKQIRTLCRSAMGSDLFLCLFYFFTAKKGPGKRSFSGAFFAAGARYKIMRKEKRPSLATYWQTAPFLWQKAEIDCTPRPCPSRWATGRPFLSNTTWPV